MRRYNVRHESCSHSPGWLPRLLMMATDAQADLSIGLEATTRCHEAEAGGSQRVRRREDDAAMVEAVAVD